MLFLNTIEKKNLNIFLNSYLSKYVIKNLIVFQKINYYLMLIIQMSIMEYINEEYEFNNPVLIFII